MILMDFPKITHDSATADNAVATITITASNTEANYLAHISASFDNTVTDIPITVKDGTTVVWEDTLPSANAESWAFLIPLKMTAGNDLVIELGASGTAGTSGTVHAWYFQGE